MVKSGCSETHGVAASGFAKKYWLLQTSCRTQPASWERLNMSPVLSRETTAVSGERLSTWSGVSSSEILAPVTGQVEMTRAGLLSTTGNPSVSGPHQA